MVTIDLALRNAALFAVRGDDGSQFTAPFWAQKSGLRDLLRQLQSACALQRITRHSIADELSLDHNTVDGWFDGKSVPSLRNLKELAGLFSRSTPNNDPVELRRLLERTAGITRLTNQIRAFIGEHRFDRLVEKYIVYTRQAYQIMRPSPLRVSPLPVNRDLLLMWGSQREDSDYVLRRLHDEEQDLIWQTEIRSLTQPWLVRIMQIFHSLRRHVLNAEDLPDSVGSDSADVQSLLERVNELGQVPIRSLDLDGSYPPDVRAYLAECALHEAEPRIAIAHLKKAIQEVPSHPGYHQYLGFALEAAGDVEGAIHEYELSLQLDLSDPNPLMYIGMAKYYSRDFESAIDYLSQATEQLGPDNETLNLHLGMSLREVEKYPEALKAFELIIDRTPDHAWALDWAAEGALKSDDRVKGRRYATRAWRLGQPAVYDMIQSGEI